MGVGGKGSTYDIFVSYSHASDLAAAQAIQSALELFAKPWYKRRSFRVFRDETSLGLTPELWPKIEQALKVSEHFLLIASPKAAESIWIRKEIEFWLREHSHTKFFIVVTGGELYWDDKVNDFNWQRTTAIPRNLRGVFSSQPRWLHIDQLRDLNKDLNLDSQEFTSFIADIAGPLSGTSPDVALDTHFRRTAKNLGMARRVIAALLLLTSSLIIVTVFALAQRRQAIKASKIALSRQLAAQANRYQDEQYDLSLLLAVEAKNAFNTVEARSSILNSLVNKPYITSVIHIHKFPVMDIDFNRSRGLLASIDYGGYDLRKKKESSKHLLLSSVHNLKSSCDPMTTLEEIEITCIEFIRNGILLVAGKSDKNVDLWRIGSCKSSSNLNDFLDSAFFDIPFTSISCMSFNPVNGALALVENFHRIYLWNTKDSTFYPIQESPYNSSVICIEFSPDGNILGFGCEDGTVHIWDVEKEPRFVDTLMEHKRPVKCLAFNPSSDQMASGSMDSTIIVWQVGDTIRKREILRRHFGSVNGVAFDSSGKILASASNDGTIILWSMKNGRPYMQPISAHAGGVTDIVSLGDGQCFASCGMDKTILLWDMNQKQSLIDEVDCTIDSVVTLACSPFSGELAAGTSTGKLLIRNKSVQGSSWEIVGNLGSAIRKLEFIPKSSLLVSRVGKRELVIWDTKACHRVYELHSDTCVNCPGIDFAVSEDGRFLVASIDSSLRIWDLADMHAPSRLLDSGSLWWNLCLNPSGKQLAVAQEQDILVYNLSSNALSRRLPRMHTDNVSKLCFSPNGTQMVSGGLDGTLFMWDMEKFRAIGGPMMGHGADIIDIEFNKDGTMIASCASKEIILWDAGTRQQIGPSLLEHDNNIDDLEFSQDGNVLISCSLRDGIFFWDVLLESWIRRISHKLNRNLTTQEWRTYIGNVDYIKTFKELPIPDEDLNNYLPHFDG